MGTQKRQWLMDGGMRLNERLISQQIDVLTWVLSRSYKQL
jgi:hypothetical protein